MLNRMKLLNMNMYDLLIKINDKIKNKEGKCILDMVEEKPVTCPSGKTCEECVQAYLNQGK